MWSWDNQWPPNKNYPEMYQYWKMWKNAESKMLTAYSETDMYMYDISTAILNLQVYSIHEVFYTSILGEI